MIYLRLFFAAFVFCFVQKGNISRLYRTSLVLVERKNGSLWSVQNDLYELNRDDAMWLYKIFVVAHEAEPSCVRLCVKKQTVANLHDFTQSEVTYGSASTHPRKGPLFLPISFLFRFSPFFLSFFMLTRFIPRSLILKIV